MLVYILVYFINTVYYSILVYTLLQNVSFKTFNECGISVKGL